MSRFLRRLSAASAALVLAIVAFGTLMALSSGGGRVEVGIDAGAAPLDDEQRIERGRYLAIAGNCASCHTESNAGLMAGGVAFRTEFGTIFSTNITPDPETGIGDWSLADFATSMRHGRRPSGEHLYPVFPYTSFTRMSDDDLVDLFAYLRSLPAVARANKPNELGFPFGIRSLMAVWKTLYFEPGPYRADESRPAEWNRGAYLVEALAHCGECHSPRNALGAKDADRLMAGGVYEGPVPGGGIATWSAPNLTGAQHGLGMWPREELEAYLKTGRNDFVETFGPMNEVIVNSTRFLTDDDIRAMSVYLKSLPALEETHEPATNDRLLGMGRTQYNLHCGTCHLPSGLGDPEMAPRLARGSLVVRADNPASLINVILYSPEPPHLPTASPWRNPMDEFQFLLNDEEVAALASFIRSSWDNAAGRVTADQVARQRPQAGR